MFKNIFSASPDLHALLLSFSQNPDIKQTEIDKIKKFKELLSLNIIKLLIPNNLSIEKCKLVFENMKNIPQI